jgi:hypothetical protein
MAKKKKKLDLSEVLNEYTNRRGFHTEGESGVNSLEELVKAMGYEDQFGTAIDHFLSDNSGCIQAILEWIGEQNIQEWAEGIESQLTEEDDEDSDERDEDEDEDSEDDEDEDD